LFDPCEIKLEEVVHPGEEFLSIYTKLLVYQKIRRRQVQKTHLDSPIFADKVEGAPANFGCWVTGREKKKDPNKKVRVTVEVGEMDSEA